MGKELKKEYRDYLRNIGEIELLNKRKTIFLTTSKMTGHCPWKFLEKEKKLYHISAYIKLHNLHINIQDISKYRLLNIVYIMNPGIIKSMEFILN